MAGLAEQATQEAQTEPRFVVGIGASAGGLEPLEQFFAATPASSGMAFVVVQHLSPDYPSLMNELLARHTSMKIRRVEDGMRVGPDAVYLIPARMNMVIENGHLRLIEQEREDEQPPLPIDVFFNSLAKDQGERAVAIVLSGTGTDGSRGIAAIKKAGGLVLVQDKITAKFGGMPRAALETGHVDAAVTPDEMPGFLASYADDPTRIPDIIDNLEELEGLDAVIDLLNREYDIDFALYKPSTVHRRIERRIMLGSDTDIDGYVDHLKSDPQELNRLYRDLMIGVTQFFRDTQAFQSLAQNAVPDIFRAKSNGEEIRAWVAGCATGEEAYTVAMLLDEERRRLGRDDQPIRVFATDAHRTSIDFAAAGRYPADRLRDVMPDRLSRYFAPVGSDFQVIPDLRQMITFATHNLISDAPFTRMDLVTCRNVLIYFKKPLQSQVISLLHFALNANGFMYLGPSETAQPFRDEFEPIDPHWRIYRKRRDVRLIPPNRLPTRTPSVSRKTTPTPLAHRVVPTTDSRLMRVYDTLLEQAMKPAVLVNEQRHVLHVFGAASDLLTIRSGRTSQELLSMVPPSLQSAVGMAIQRCRVEDREINVGRVRVDDERVVSVSARPVKNEHVDGVDTLIQFDIKHAAQPDAQPDARADVDDQTDATNDREFDSTGASEEALLSLEEELQHTKESLQTTIEELETANEELNATNEELIASNEELQSTNEELHSVNEE
ncbi:MAG: chemotaxis protein CheB, partial [Planctomycetota bacterium]